MNYVFWCSLRFLLELGRRFAGRADAARAGLALGSLIWIKLLLILIFVSYNGRHPYKIETRHNHIKLFSSQ